MNTQELKAKREQAHKAAEAVVAVAERQSRPMTALETQTFDTRMREVKDYDSQIAAAKPKSVADFRAELAKIPRHTFAPETLAPSENYGKTPLVPRQFSREYKEGF